MKRLINNYFKFLHRSLVIPESHRTDPLSEIVLLPSKHGLHDYIWILSTSRKGLYNILYIHEPFKFTHKTGIYLDKPDKLI